MKHEDLTSWVIGICIKIHSILGPGLLESVYEEALCYELTQQGIHFRRQEPVHVLYEDVNLGIGFRADVIVEESLVVELKSTQGIAPVHAKTVLTYLRFTEIEVGLIINFNVLLLKDGIKRLILDRRNPL